jgi:hypothetical protein
MICKTPTPVVLNSKTNDIAGKLTKQIDAETGFVISNIINYFIIYYYLFYLIYR